MTLDEVLKVLQTHCDTRGGQVGLAREWKMSQGHISDVLGKRAVPGPKILTRLGMKEMRSYDWVAGGGGG